MLYMFLADGFEETEAIGSLDVIRRAEIDIKTVSIKNENKKQNIFKGFFIGCRNIQHQSTEVSDGTKVCDQRF